MVATTAPAPVGARPTTRGHAPAGLVAAALGIGALFAFPLAYLLWNTIGLGADFFDILRAEDVGEPLRNSLLLATTVALGATALGTALAWLVTRTNLPGRRAWRIVVPLPLVMPSFVGAFALIAAFAPGGLLDEVVGFDQAPRDRGLLGDVARPHAAHLPLRVPAGRGPARLVATLPRGERAGPRPESPRGLPHRRPAPVQRRDVGGCAARVPVLLERVRRGPAAPLRDADARDLRVVAVRPRRGDVAEPRARRRCARGRRRGTHDLAPAGADRRGRAGREHGAERSSVRGAGLPSPSWHS